MQKSSLSKLKKYMTKKNLFYFVMIVGLLLSFRSVFLTHGKSLTTILFSNPDDSFMDFFNPINYVGSNPYLRGDIYPPLAYSLYLMFSKMLPSSVILYGGDFIRSNQLGLFLFALYTSISAVVLIFIVRFCKKGNEIERFIFSIIILFSAPFVFQLERANIILVSLVFLILFTFLRNSENKYLKELSYVCLAISAAIKIYPAIFAILLIKEGKIKETLRCACYTILLFTLPFFFFGGLKNVSIWIDNLQKGIKLTGDFGFGYQINYANFVKILFAFQNHYEPNISNLGNNIALILLVLSLIAVFLLKTPWKVVCLLSLLCIGFPSISYFYASVFMIIPLILFLDSNDERSVFDIIYVILFSGIFLPLTYGEANFFPHLITLLPLSISCYTACACIFIMTILLILEGIANISFCIGSKKPKKNIRISQT